ncbi:DUF1839 family protein [Piscinibacter sakaiensis]|uniref:DUF1839 family protein n=1 Tax=Piscinibacter sakaiensis TaxID=1547922 RepID=A0A0K8NZY1_PISS1|nr:DUF1839 family protein [Piscinibacter sakaiensis]GAP35844.1 hypothetical protein ISF6_1617 [Piscinibacter sakaiensis]
MNTPATPAGPRPAIDLLPGLDPAAHVPHALHAPPSVWTERNCYIDLWIELVHALGADPHAMLPVVLALDFEGDQWTFFKPSHAALWTLYGLDVQELTVWRPMLEHLREHLGAGRLPCIEADSHWMPDTAGTDYRRRHGKTSIVVTALDEGARRLHYLHNAGHHALEGEDFDRLLDVGAPAAELPLFAELIKIDRLRRRPPAELRALALAELRIHLARRPADNPVERFAARLAAELPALREAGLDHYHRWAFGTIRQLGAAFELAARLADWFAGGPPTAAAGDWAAAAREFDAVSTHCKAQILKTARIVAGSKPFDAAEAWAPAAQAWARGMAAMDAAAGVG